MFAARRYSALLTLFVLSLVLTPQVPAQMSVLKPGVLEKVTGSPRSTLLNINNISMWASDNGVLERRPIDRTAGVTFPRGTATVMFAGGILWGGRTVDGVLVGGQSYTSGTVPGAIVRPGIVEDPTNNDVRIYRIRRDWATADLKRDAGEYYDVPLLDVSQSQIDALREQYRADWREWPWQKGAPYYERNGIPGYQPPLGEKYDATADEPGLADASQVIWFVTNDLDEVATRALYGSSPIGIETQVTCWAYSGRGDLDNVIYQRHRLIYKGLATTPSSALIDSMYIAKWADPDIGSFSDDLVGCVPEDGLGFAYNYNPTDIEFSKFHLTPPAVGYDLVQGPRVAKANATAHWDLKTISGYENLPMTTFAYFTKDSRTSDFDLGNYNGTREWYNVFRGFKPLPISPPQCLTDPTTNACTNFELWGDPQTLRGWVDGRRDVAGDRRFAMVSGPFRMALGDTQEVVVALIAGQGRDNRDAVGVLKRVDGSAQDAFNLNFNFPQPVPVPPLRITELDNKFILDWESDTAQVRAIETYGSKGFTFETYTLYQFPRPDSPLSDAVVFPPFDITMPRSMNIVTDLIRNRPLINGQKYYYALTSTMFNSDPAVEVQRLESPVVMRTAVPHRPNPGTVYPYAIDEAVVGEQDVRNTVGVDDAVVNLSYYDPSKQSGGRYKVRFHRTPVQILDIDEKPTWDFIQVEDSVSGVAVGGDLSGTLRQTFLRTRNGGGAWSAQVSPSTDVLFSAALLDKSTGLAVGSNGTILRSANSGTEWNLQASGVVTDLFSVAMIDTNIAVIAGEGGVILRTTNGGIRWSSTLPPRSADFYAVTFLDQIRGFAVGSGGTILHTINGAKVDTILGNPRTGWYVDSSRTTEDLLGVTMTDLFLAFAVGRNGTILRTTDGGTTWSPMISGTSVDLHDIAFTDPNLGTAVGAGGTILRTTDRGLSWIPQSSGTISDLRDISFADSANAFVVSVGGEVLSTSDGGTIWIVRNVTGGSPLYGIAASNEDRLLKGLRVDVQPQRIATHGILVNVTPPFLGMKGVYEASSGGAPTRTPVFNTPNPQKNYMVVGAGSSDLDSVRGGSASDVDIELRFLGDSSWALLRKSNAVLSRWIRVPYTAWAVSLSGKDSVRHQFYTVITDAGQDSVWRPEVLLDRSYEGKTLKVFYPIIVVSDSIRVDLGWVGNRYYDDVPFRSDAYLLKGYLYVSSSVRSEPKASIWKAFIADIDEDGIAAPIGTVIRFERLKQIRNRDEKSFAPRSLRTADLDAAKEEVKLVNVFPNPYYGLNKYELSKSNRFVTFSHLSRFATIKIFTLAGVPVKSLEKDSEQQFHEWDLKNEFGLPVAAGVYLAHIELKDAQRRDLGSKTLKLMIVPETQY